ncbi:MAG: peptidoglycan-associated lipoprotein Pal [Deltaproteobacteria bacterium]|nr:peptidoglycan-associated lipoprotein Pal [Deltaproteobacteria bacterium]MBI4224265.1 peptidoglycan-associated lipoprotein Pal [Deltaproteobacteria bacterium]
MKTTHLFLALAVAGLLVAGCAQQTTRPSAKGLERIHFDFDKSFIKPEFEPVLKANAEWLRTRQGKNMVVEGHCDERGTSEYNIALGDRRANSAKNYLVNSGISAGRLSTVSYGEERAMANCHDENCWWKNRRAEFMPK